MAVGPSNVMLQRDIGGKVPVGGSKKNRWSSGEILSFRGHKGESDYYLKDPKHNTYTHLPISVEDIKVRQDQTKQKCAHEALKKPSTV